MPKAPAKATGIAAVIIAVLIALISGRGLTPSSTSSTRAPAAPRQSTPVAQPATPSDSTGEQAILEAFERQRSDVSVQFAGMVSKLLPDDSDGDRHQRFIVKLPSGHTVLIAHNIDAAPRVPVRERDAVTIQGEYVYSEQGGVVHFTHRASGGSKTTRGGWIEVGGKRYQ